MAKITIDQVLAKAAKQEKTGNFKKAIEMYAAPLKSGLKSTTARDGYLRCAARLQKQPVNKSEFQSRLSEIVEHVQKGNWADANAKGSAQLKLFPNNVLLLNMSAVAKLGLGQVRMASDLLNLAVALKPDYADAHQNLGLAQQQLGKPELAIKSFERAVEINPTFAKALDNLGSMHQFYGRFDEAVEFHRRAIELDPNALEARRNAAVAYRKLKFYPEALAEYRWIIGAGEESAQNYYGVGALLRKLENPSDALVAIDKSLELDPSYVPAHLERGNSLRLLARKEEAEQSYRSALKIEPTSARAYFGLSSVTKLKKDDEEIEQLLQLLDDESQDFESLSLLNFTLAYAFENSADLESSFVYLKTANAHRKKHLQYSIETDKDLFAEIKANGEVLSSLRLPEGIEPLKYTPFFIFGMPRSGTTLTEQIISAHPDVSGCGELNFASQYGMKIARGEVEVTPEAVAKFRAEYINAVGTLEPEASIITDKMPHNFRIIGLLAAAFPEAKFVHTKRDPGAVCWSNFYISFGSNGLGYSYDLDDVVEFFGMYQDMVGYWNDLLGDRIYNLDYELLTQDQETETHKLIDYLDIGWNEACLSPEKNDRKVLTASYSQVKKSVYKGSSQKWRRFEPYLGGAFDQLSW